MSDGLTEARRAAGYVWPPVSRSQQPAQRYARYVFGASITPEWGFQRLPLGNVRFTNGARSATGSDLQYGAFNSAIFAASLVVELPYLFLAVGGAYAFTGNQLYFEGRSSVAFALRHRFALFALGPAVRVWQFNAMTFASGESATYTWSAPVAVDAAIEFRVELALPNRCQTEATCRYLGYALRVDLPITAVGAFFVGLEAVIGSGRR